jgi:hypothetical protein
MTLEEMKIKVLTLIEEYDEEADDLTLDTDIATKLNGVINQIQNELTRFKKIPKYKVLSVKKGEEMKLSAIDPQIYQLKTIKDVDYELFDDLVIFGEDGQAKLFYYKYPETINQDTSDTYTFEITNDLLEIMPYGVAGDLLKSDVSSNYGVVYYNRYRELLKELDPRYNLGGLSVEGGCDI